MSFSKRWAFWGGHPSPYNTCCACHDLTYQRGMVQGENQTKKKDLLWAKRFGGAIDDSVPYYFMLR